jgi:hypothetical protein
MKPVLKRINTRHLQEVYKDNICTESLKCNVKIAINSLIDYLGKEDDYDYLAHAIERIVAVDMIHNNLEKEAKECMKKYNKTFAIIQ